MDGILEDLWYGNINPQEQSMAKNRVTKELRKLMERNRNRLNATLTAEQREIFTRYTDCIDELHGIMELEIFSYAFRLGGKLMLAMIKDDCTEI